MKLLTVLVYYHDPAGVSRDTLAAFAGVWYNFVAIQRQTGRWPKAVRPLYLGGENLRFAPISHEGGDRMITLSFSDICLFCSMVIQLIALIWGIKKK